MPQPIDFLSLAKAETNARKRIRLLALAHFQDGHTRTQIALFLKVGRNSVNKWVTRFHSHGLAGLDSIRPPGRIADLNPQERTQLHDFIDEQSRRTTGGRLRGADIQAYIEYTFGVTYQLSNIYRLLKQMRLSWITRGVDGGGEPTAGRQMVRDDRGSHVRRSDPGPVDPQSSAGDVNGRIDA